MIFFFFSSLFIMRLFFWCCFFFFFFLNIPCLEIEEWLFFLLYGVWIERWFGRAFMFNGLANSLGL